jgi:nucleoside-diphosphate-sugar epimerase
MTHGGRAVLVAGGGGFIGGHLTRALLEDGYDVCAIDAKPIASWHQAFEDAENTALDLTELESCRRAVAGVNEIYNVAADMGGMGFIESNKALCMLSSLINTHLLLAARDEGVDRFFYASSACVYPVGRQDSPEVRPLAEDEAYPAMPEDGYGWEKLFGERLCAHFREDFGLQTTIARFHNVYGPHGAWAGGREKAPAAICRKVAEAVLTGSGEIEIWGDGSQTRSFTYVDDAVHGTLMISRGDYHEPLNLGSSEMVSIDGLVSIIEEIAGVTVRRRYRPDAPQGVRGRNSDNTLIRSKFGWEPATRLRDGLVPTYRWIHDRVAAGLGERSAPISKPAA